MNKCQICAVIIAKNEADRIGTALQSVQFCDEIIVIDSHSTDQTASIAKQFGARVIQQDFLGFGAQKNFGFTQANSEWILSIDADEEISKPLAEEIQQTITKQSEIVGYSLRRKNFFLGKELKYGKESKDFLIRLFKKGYGKYEENEVHEVMHITGKVKSLQHSFYHYTYRSLEHARQKMQSYAKLGAKELAKRNRNRNPFLIFLSYPVYFFKHYIMHGNVLNGKAGFVWSKLMANYHCKKYIYLNQTIKNT